MWKTRDTIIASLNEALWIPGSSKTYVLINFIFICRNKTRIKQASIHTNHFSITSTVQHRRHFRDWAGGQTTENYRLGPESHFLTFCLQLKWAVMLRSNSKENRHFLNHNTPNCSGTAMRWRQLICSPRQQVDNSSRLSNLDNKRELQFYSSDGSHKKRTWE